MGETVDELIARMAALLEQLQADGDPGRFFLGTYLRITEAVRTALRDGLFEAPGWVAEGDVDFAGLYLHALEGSRRDPGAPAAPRRAPAAAPAPWRRAFGAAPSLRPEAHVLLGVNAHINFDLPQSLVAMIPPPDFTDPLQLSSRERDHDRVDDVLASRVSAEDGALERAG